MIETILTVLWVVSLLVLLGVAVFGALSGMRRGAYRAGVKLLALLVSVALSLVLTLLLRGVLGDLMRPLLPEEMQEYQELIGLVVQIPAAAGMLVAFWVIFTVVRLLMLIPQKIVCKLLPRTFDEAVGLGRGKKKAHAGESVAQSTPTLEETPAELSAEAELAQAQNPAPEASAAEDVALASDELTADASIGEDAGENPAPQEEVAEIVEPVQADVGAVNAPLWQKILWRTGAAVCGMLSSVLLLGAVMMPVSAIAVRGGEAVSRVAATLADENYGKYSAEISGYADTLGTAPLFVVTDFFYGNTVFEPLTSFSTEYGKINLSDELENATDILCNVLPAIIHTTKGNGLEEGDVDRLESASEDIAESPLLLYVGTYYLRNTAEEMKEEETEEKTPGKAAFENDFISVLEEMTPDALADDLKTIAELVNTLRDSALMETITDDEKKLAVEDIADRVVLRSVFGILYDNHDARSLLVSLVNLGSETVFKELGVMPIYSTADLDQVSREEMIAEADRLCDAILGLMEFSESADASDNAASMLLAEAGKALDSLRDSVFYGNQYEPLVRSLAAVGSTEENDTLLSELTDALVKSDSAEKLLTSAQNVLILNEELEKNDKKGSENEKLISSLDVLINQTSAEDAETLGEVADGVFEGREDGLGNEYRSQMVEDCVGALAAVTKTGSEDLASEADAVQAIYALTHTDEENAFVEVSEEKTVNAMLKSRLAQEMLKKANAEGRDYGVQEKLSTANKANIKAALDAADADAAAKEAIGTFFGVN